MSAADVKVAAARGEVELRRQRLLGTVDEIKHRLAPKTIALDAWTGAKEKGTELADTGISAVKQRPAVAVGVAASAALLLARKPIYNLLSGLFGSRHETADSDEDDDHEFSRQ